MMRNRASIRRDISYGLVSILALFPLAAAIAQTPPMQPDIPAQFAEPEANFDYVKREVMVPMRDGVKLFTVVILPKGASHLPILLTRTPYDAGDHVRGSVSTFAEALPKGDDVFAADRDYIRVFQDVRGKYGSEGDYVMTRPPVGPLNKTAVDETTDAWDTIDWLVRNVPESNGKVGMRGSSYEGFTVAMALLDPHPALKVASPESPMIDGWLGDDWFHNGAFRQQNFDYFPGQTGKRSGAPVTARPDADDYTNFLRAGSAGDWARRAGMGALPWWRKLEEHPAYDAFWQGQALDKLLGARKLTVPVIWEQGLWDQEDIYGANHAYQALEAQDVNNDKNFLVMGPWRHSQVNSDGRSLGALKFEGDTALQYRRDVLKPLFDQYLKDGARKADTPPVLIYRTGFDRWDRLDKWPPACAQGCQNTLKPLYLQANGSLSFAPSPQQGADEFVSDPAKPVPYRPRPIDRGYGGGWPSWLVVDQRFVDGRPDVLTYQTEPLTAAVQLSGAPLVKLLASTTGTDSDWIVKLIDVYPGQMPSQPEMGGYQLAISLDIFRGRYRRSFAVPGALAAGKPLRYEFPLPNVNHVFLPGHRIMVQIQSTLFPLYDRNPQTYVDNIFHARSADYRKATQRVFYGGASGTAIELPVVPFVPRDTAR